MKTAVSALYQKNGLAAIYLAQNLLGKQKGDRMDTIVDIAAELKVGRGTVQTAIGILESAGAISLEVQGHLGTYIQSIDYAALLKISGISHIVGVMPLPYSRRYEGFATGIYNVLNEASDVPASLAFMAGAQRRVESLLEERYNFAVMSRETAEHYLNKHDNLQLMFVFSDYTYVNEHAFISRKDFQGWEGSIRIGVDYSSFDQLSRTTRFLKNKTVELISVKYSNIIHSIKSGIIDGAVWSIEESIQNDKELRIEMLGEETQSKKNTQAGIVVRKDDPGTQNYLKRYFDCNRVEAIQQQVLSDQLTPNY